MLELKIKCGKCASCCCYAIPVVTHHDVKRITKETGMEPTSFVKMYSSREIALEPDDEGWVKMSQGKRIMGLKQKHDGCIFLAKDKGCTAYKARPITCRTYPFHIELDHKGRLTTLKFQEKASHKGKSCTATPRIARNSNRVIKDAKKEDCEDASYWEKCSKWNKSKRQKRTLKDFLAFLGL